MSRKRKIAVPVILTEVPFPEDENCIDMRSLTIYDEIHESIDRDNIICVVQEAMRRLSPRELTVIQRLFWQEDAERPTYKELADELGVTEGTICVHYRRALDKMRAFLEEANVAVA